MKYVVISALFLLGACDKPTDPHSSADNSSVWFADVASDVGLNFTYVNGESGELYFPATVGGGIALLDFDQDGDLDVYLTQGGELPYQNAKTPQDKLFRNELIPVGELRFLDVTETAGLENTGYGMGVAVGDWNNDDFPDLFVSNFGANALYQNTGQGNYVSIELQDDPGRWSTSGSFFDHENDGLVDLFFVDYVAFDININRPCSGMGGEREYCGPKTFQHTPGNLWKYQNGKFLDHSKALGVNTKGSGLGVVARDVNEDQITDVYVANDSTLR